MNRTRHCDVLIVGGGPAGAACAWQLCRHGRDVVVIDKARFPRDKVCAGWVTPQVLASLQIDSAAYASQRVLQPITGFRVGLVGRRLIDAGYDRVVSYGIRRCEFDHFLLHRSGAELYEGTAVRSLQRTPAGWRVNDEFTARVLVGAGGHFCPVLRWLTAHESAFADSLPTKNIVAAQEVEFAMTPQERQQCSVRAEVPELYFYPDLQGYAWCFRKGDYLNIGLGRMHGQSLHEYREQLLEWLVSSGRLMSVPKQRFKGHAYRLHVRPENAKVSDRVLLIGDAAGLAAPHSGEGIRPAIESGLIAADVVLKAGESLNTGSLREHAAELRRRLPSSSLSGDFGMAVRRVLAGWLLSKDWFVRRWLLDECFLNRSQPGYQAVAPPGLESPRA